MKKKLKEYTTSVYGYVEVELMCMGQVTVKAESRKKASALLAQISGQKKLKKRKNIKVHLDSFELCETANLLEEFCLDNIRNGKLRNAVVYDDDIADMAEG